MHTSKIRFFAVAAVAAMALAACSSSAKTASPETSPNTTTAPTEATTVPTPTAAGGGATAKTTVAIADSKFGKILVDGNGMTLYVDENDKPGKPACTGACLQAWPPVAAPETFTGGAGVDGKLYSDVTLSDGTKQLAVNGSPLYTWMNDKKAGDVTGQDVNGFYAVMANGEKYDPGASDDS
jgi:predicted lipoprotein with Yx(FWY)xxD motif